MIGARDLVRPLSQLEGAGMIELATTEPDLEYLFRHVLIQEAAYDSLLRQERRQLHRDVADCMESLYPERLDELAPVIAMHLEAAGEAARAVDYFMRAGRFALSRFANHEAKDAFDRARALVDGEATDVETRRRRAEIDLGRVEAGFSYVPADIDLEILDSVRADAEAIGDDALLGHAYLRIALIRTFRGEQYATSPELREALDRGLELAERSGDVALRAEPLAVLGGAKASAGEYAASAEILERAIPLLQSSGRLERASLYAGTLALSYARLGRFGRAVEWIDRSTELARRSGDPSTILDADLVRSMIEALRGNSSVAIDFAAKAATQADDIDNKACAMVARSIIGEQRLLLGQPDQAIRVLEEGARLAAYCDMVPIRVEFTQALLDSARAQSGDGSAPPDRLDRTLEIARVSGDRFSEGEILRLRARDRLRCDGPTEAALADFAAAEDVFRVLGAVSDLAVTIGEHAAAAEAAGRANEAEALRAEAGAVRASFEAVV